MRKHFGSIEAGGTKFVLAVVDQDYKVLKREEIPTTMPDETLARCVRFFQHNPVMALGIGSFGPISIDPKSSDYGHVLATTKEEWRGADVVGPLRHALGMPIVFTSDVNASAYGEYTQGAGKDVQSLVYFTIGTGIGGGAIQNNQFIGGVSHAEMGHTLVQKHPEDNFEGICSYHGRHCFEGVASGPAIQARTGLPGEKLSRDNKVFDFISYYAAQLVFNTYLNFAPARVVFGGSVLKQTELPKILKYVEQFNAGYVNIPDLKKMIVLSEIPNNGSATLGNAALAMRTIDLNLK